MKRESFDVNDVHTVFSEHANPRIARRQNAYMKNKFEFYGIQSVKRRELQQPFLVKKWLPAKAEAFQLIRDLWAAPQREMQYFALDLISRYHDQWEKGDATILEFLITEKSWWDTVDFLAVNSVGTYLKKFPEKRDGLVENWLASGNIWLQRSCLLFQLKYKDELDVSMMASVIGRLKGSREFFINKAIGWILREYSKTNPEWVDSYIRQSDLHPMSRREGMKWINKTKPSN